MSPAIEGACFDNTCAESLFSTLTNKLVHHHTLHAREEARTAIFEYIEIFVTSPAAVPDTRLSRAGRV